MYILCKDCHYWEQNGKDAYHGLCKFMPQWVMKKGISGCYSGQTKGE